MATSTYSISGDPHTMFGYEVGRYIRTIRNKAKQDYARSFYVYVLKNRKGPEPQYSELSYMGAQAVRMRIDSIFRVWFPNR